MQSIEQQLQSALAAHQAGDVSRAEQGYLDVLALQPKNPDANNMLGVVLGYAELLESMLTDQPKLAKYANQIHKAGERGAKLTKRLLEQGLVTPSMMKQLKVELAKEDA